MTLKAEDMETGMELIDRESNDVFVVKRLTSRGWIVLQKEGFPEVNINPKYLSRCFRKKSKLTALEEWELRRDESKTNIKRRRR